MEQLTAFERGQIVGALSTGASVAKTAELFNVSKETVTKVMTAYSKHSQADIEKRKQNKQQKTAKHNSCTDINIHPLNTAVNKQSEEEEDEDAEVMNTREVYKDEEEGSSEDQNQPQQGH